jgi:HD-GYP domain-containing protein (c-di-GMP phosphodiesterase class II)
MLESECDLLVVDDDQEILDLLTVTFADYGYRLQTAACLVAARAALARCNFKIVLCDCNLSDGNGVDFLAELSSSATQAVPILMTGLLDVRVAIEAINRGKVYKFVTKPLDLMMLIHTIRRALDHHVIQNERRQLTLEMLAQNEHLRREVGLNERNLRMAAERIRLGEATVEKQQSHIESLSAEVHRGYLQTVTSLSAAIEAKDKYTRGHSERVYYYCSLMADAFGLSEASRSDLRFACVLHDVGKIGIPDSILSKPGPLTPDEYSVIVTHPVLTDEILQHLPFLASVRRIVSEHHERFDGQGYPKGLKGEEISLEGRMLCIADAYDAMRSDRPYRRALSTEEAASELTQGAGGQFCPLCVGSLVLSLRIKGEYAAKRGSFEPDNDWVADYCESHFAHA